LQLYSVLQSVQPEITEMAAHKDATVSMMEDVFI